MNNDIFIIYLMIFGVYIHYKALLLIIWPSIFGDTEYRLKKNSLARSYEVMVNERMDPIDPNDASLIEPDVASFNKLMQAAKLKWETF